jgi:hypothetical protein
MRDRVDGRAVLRGAAVGLAVIVPVTIVRVVVERHTTDFSTSAWVYPLSLLIVLAYGLAGAAAGRSAPVSPALQGALAGVGAVVVWVPVRVVIWAVREGDRSLVTGDRAALPPGQLFGALALAALVGAAGALLAARGRRAAAVPAPPRG